ncbi:ABC transporter substrate-binding protein [bacterium]|nr:ABC transporter substrate-binding protein [bacterium]
MIAPLSGDVSAWGLDVRNSLLFAVQKLAHEKIEFVFEDDKCLGKDAVTAAHKLVSVDKVDFAMVVCTESMLATAPIFEANKIIVITPVATGDKVSAAGDYIFRTWPSDALAAQLLVSTVAKKHQRFGTITESRGFPEEFSQALHQAAAPTNLKIFDQAFLSEATDYKVPLLKLKTQNVSGILINTNSVRIYINILKQISELNWKIQIYGVYMPGNPTFIKLTGQLAEGIIYVDAPALTINLSDHGRTIYQEFLHTYGPLQSSDFVFASTYEALKLIIENSLATNDIRNVLYAQNFSGIFGKYSFDRNGDIENIKHQLKIIRHSQPVLFSPY